MIRYQLAVGLCAASLSVAQPGYADNTVLTPIRDNTLYENATGSLSNGVGTSIVAGRTNASSNSIRRALMKFDVASAVPAGATITSATLTLTLTNTSSGAQNEDLHRVAADWGEGTSNASSPGSGATSTTNDATWLHTFYNTSFWTNIGGDFSNTVSATQSVPNTNGPYIWTSSQLVTDVQSMLDTPASNFGWILVGNESAQQTTKTFGSREQTTGLQPTLSITYTTSSATYDWKKY